MLLKDKIAVITGASQGIGRYIALAYAEAGANLVLAARNQTKLEEVKREIEQLGRQALVVPTDVTQEGQVTALAEKTISHYGRADVLVNNSGIAGVVKPLWEIEPSEWDEAFNINVRGVYLGCRAFIPTMISQKSGSIITIGSMTGKRPMPHRTPYTSTKMALIGMVRTLAWDLGRHGIRANLISPGAVAGPRMDRTFVSQAKIQGITPEQSRQEYEQISPLNQLTQPEDVAQTAVFLASDMANSISGEDVNVSAGVVMY